VIAVKLGYPRGVFELTSQYVAVSMRRRFSAARRVTYWLHSGQRRSSKVRSYRSVACRSSARRRSRSPVPSRSMLRQRCRSRTTWSYFDIFAGPRADWFSSNALEHFCTQVWQVTPQSNRVGLRLHGETPLDAAADGRVAERGSDERCDTGASRRPTGAATRRSSRDGRLSRNRDRGGASSRSRRPNSALGEEFDFACSQIREVETRRVERILLSTSVFRPCDRRNIVAMSPLCAATSPIYNIPIQPLAVRALQRNCGVRRAQGLFFPLIG
jgi:hypothetical protein